VTVRSSTLISVHDRPAPRVRRLVAVPATVDFAAGDRYALRVTQSDNAGASGLSVTLPFLRTDI